SPRLLDSSGPEVAGSSDRSVVALRMGNPRALPVERITVKRGDLEEIVLPRLLGTLFHVTSPPGFEGITCFVLSAARFGTLSEHSLCSNSLDSWFFCSMAAIEGA